MLGSLKLESAFYATAGYKAVVDHMFDKIVLCQSFKRSFSLFMIYV